MDNFMDKLTKRFNAGELIAANGEAEAREANHLRQINQENDKVIAEMKRLSFKMVEIQEQVSQMLAMGIEQFEDNSASIRKDEAHFQQVAQELAKLRENGVVAQGTGESQGQTLLAIEAQAKTIEELRNSLQELAPRIDSLKQEPVSIPEYQAQFNQLAMYHSQTLQEMQKQEQFLMGLAQQMSVMPQGFNDNLQGLNVINAQSEQLSQNILQLQTAVEEVKKSIGQPQTDQVLQKQLSDATYSMEASLHQIKNDMQALSDNFAQQLASLENRVAGQKTEISLDPLSQAMEGQKESFDTSSQQIKEMIVGLKLALEDSQKHIEDYVHREDVKVYRNVQSAFNDQLSIKTRDISDRLDRIEKEQNKGKGIKPLVIVTLLMAVASLALQIVQIWGVL